MTRLDLADGLRLFSEAQQDAEFGHREHLAFAWSLLSEAEDAEDATRVALTTIRHVTSLAGNPERFHVTITVFWVRMLDAARRAHPDAGSLDDLLEVRPDLADPTLPERYYSDLTNEDTRLGWQPPDLAPLT